MQPINPTTPPLQTLGLQTTPAGTRAWQVGQVLQAITLTDTSQGKLTLQIGAQRLDAQTPIPLKAGTPLQLEVIRTGDQPVLKLLAGSAPPPNPEHQALRQALPRQAPLPPLLANLAAVAGGQAKTNLPAPVMQQVQAVLSQFAQAAQVLNPAVLRATVQQAGVFLEARLARQAAGETTVDPGKDVKAGLLKLQQALQTAARTTPQLPPSPSTPANAPQTAATPGPTRAPLATAATPLATPPATSLANAPAITPVAPAPPLRHGHPQAQAVADASLTRLLRPELAATELLRQVDGALARIQLNQLASLPSADSPQAWLLELPLKHGERTDLLHLRIDSDAQQGRGKGAQATWSMSLAFDFPELGPVHARVQVAGDQVSTVFWAERPGTARLFTEHLDLLGADLAQSGLRIGQLQCHAGRPPQNETAAPVRLLEERA